LIWSEWTNQRTRSWKSQSNTWRWTAGNEGRREGAAGGESRLGRRSGETLGDEEGVGEHHQRKMAMQAVPAAALVVAEAALPFGVLIELLDRPPQMGERRQPRAGD
jgi:hypothetical protein